MDVHHNLLTKAAITIDATSIACRNLVMPL
jgi:hypothetical protein